MASFVLPLIGGTIGFLVAGPAGAAVGAGGGLIVQPKTPATPPPSDSIPPAIIPTTPAAPSEGQTASQTAADVGFTQDDLNSYFSQIEQRQRQRQRYDELDINGMEIVDNNLGADLISGVPNWALYVGAGAAVYFLLLRKRF